ncbi:MAG: hypothetical protein EOR84_18745 [Mesorhizobium sp.]|uniref:hypothetical protein n=1 Tax=Mesorhizobium sp. TaxID=1871066 RepID=UPI000FE78E4C|nr:hypothetical protein [Mesorhizobium sp.]RWM92872.1 MAG: hypothetical protein EOR84_18745 [Mesorhizobium sp.]
MRYARIIDGVVDSIAYDLPYFQGGPEPGWTEVPDDVFAGFSFEGEKFTGPEPTPPPRQTVLKSLVQARIIEAALTQNPVYFARWFAPDRPEVYCDDPDAILLVTALGLDPDAILAPIV